MASFWPVLLIIVIILQLILFWQGYWRHRDGMTPLLNRRFQELFEALEGLKRETHEEAQRNRKEWTENSTLSRRETQDQLAKWMSSLNQVASRQSAALRGSSEQTLGMVTRSLQEMRLETNQSVESMRQTMETRLEEMRATVDEKLHQTLEQRLGDSFRIVSERLEQVHQGLGEMHALAGGVGDLKRILSHVKVRGIWGEVQLAQLLDQVFTKEQYQANVIVRPNSAERVDFAIKLPGQGERDSPVWLPIDAKFPLEDYQRLLDAEEKADTGLMEEAAKNLERRVRDEATSIRKKYIDPPHTTDFAVMFVPLEGLYAELLRRPGLLESLQHKERVILTGPTTLGAILTSLQIGFRTLVIERRSSEVWQLLGSIKHEFQKFGESLEKVRKRIEQAGQDFQQIETRTRVINQRLRTVEELPAEEPFTLE